jgi:soluble lytic murein transglycosylase-like protein
MTRRIEDLRYVIGAAALLVLAAVLFAIAAKQLRASAPQPAGAEPRTRSSALPARGPSSPAAAERHERIRLADTANELLHADGLAAARRRLASAPVGPDREVDRWALRLATNRGSSEAALQRFAVYRPLIQQTLRRYGLPNDLAYIPWVESEWRNDRVSHAGADGMWQFIPYTARGYGLEVSAYVDERRDPVRATDAAARYLRDLMQETADWHTTLAAYNAGLGRVGRGGSFWHRRRTLPAETRAYVPKVLAAARVGRAPGAWGLRPSAAPPLRFREVWFPGGTPLDSIAANLDLPAHTLRELNPHLVRSTTPPGRRWPVRVPTSARMSIAGPGPRR